MSDDIVDEIVRDVELREGGFSFNDFIPGLDYAKEQLRILIKEQIAEWEAKGFTITFAPPWMTSEYVVKVGKDAREDDLMSDEDYYVLRKEAMAKKKKYYQGKPCKLGHTKRTVSTDNCSVCSKNNSTRNRARYMSMT